MCKANFSLEGKLSVPDHSPSCKQAPGLNHLEYRDFCETGIKKKREEEEMEREGGDVDRKEKN